ncbi:MAG: helix-turn-helix domain-containing protein [Planctomycetota bacterium]
MSKNVAIPLACWQPGLRHCGDLHCSCGFLPGSQVQVRIDDPGKDYRWLLLIQGEAHCSDETGSWRLRPGDVFIRPARSPHRIVRPDPDRYLEWYLRLSESQLRAAREWGLIQHTLRCFHLPLSQWLDRILDWCHELDAAGKAETRRRQWCFLLELLAQSQLQAGGDVDLRARAERLLSQEPQRPRAISAVAAELGISQARLRRLMQDAHGMGPKAYQNRQRIQVACGLLMHRSLSIVQVAERLGYPDAFTFSKQFRRVMGQSPTAYRQW